MSTLATAALSSDEEDDDFVPTLPKVKRKSKSKPKEPRVKRVRNEDGSASDSASCSSSSGSENEDGDGDGDGDEEERENKRAKVEDEVAERRRKAREEFERIKADLQAGSTSGPSAGKGQVEMVDVRRARRFAGETIYETVKLRADDPEAIAYLATIAQEQAQGQDTAKATTSENTLEPVDTTSDAINPIEQASRSDGRVPLGSAAPTSTLIPTHSDAPAPVPEPSLAPTPTPAKKAPPRRKPRQSLEAMSAALDKGKKMTMLEKSQMDWKSHTTSERGMADELAANRRSGGYLDKRDFLDRVSERKEGSFGAGASARR